MQFYIWNLNTYKLAGIFGAFAESEEEAILLLLEKVPNDLKQHIEGHIRYGGWRPQIITEHEKSGFFVFYPHMPGYLL